MRWAVIVMGWPSEGDFRFLTAVRNDSRGVRNDGSGCGMPEGVRNGNRGTHFIVILRSALPPCHSEERTTKNLRCLLMRWACHSNGLAIRGGF